MKMVESIRNNTVEKKQQKTNRYVNIHLEKEHEAGSVSLSDIVKKVILIVTDSLELPYSDFERKHTLLFFFVSCEKRIPHSADCWFSCSISAR